jgi:hypothetical protein
MCMTTGDVGRGEPRYHTTLHLCFALVDYSEKFILADAGCYWRLRESAPSDTTLLIAVAPLSLITESFDMEIWQMCRLTMACSRVETGN